MFMLSHEKREKIPAACQKYEIERLFAFVPLDIIDRFGDRC